MAPVSLNYYLGSLDAPLSIVIIASIVIGIIVGASIIYASTLRLRYENNRLKKKVAIFEQEIDSLRILPIKESF
ncbi:MAG: hypothetical protein COA90_03420 [Gammaproteobacteria bacterium]|nr:MAG: hypothetical protein COA90_03420 [Gammaproteobacteria bacterium]